VSIEPVEETLVGIRGLARALAVELLVEELVVDLTLTVIEQGLERLANGLLPLRFGARGHRREDHAPACVREVARVDVGGDAEVLAARVALGAHLGEVLLDLVGLGERALRRLGDRQRGGPFEHVARGRVDAVCVEELLVRHREPPPCLRVEGTENKNPIAAPSSANSSRTGVFSPLASVEQRGLAW